ncbi:hypothetical protein CWC22_015555 [Pseudoalteromonas rubra]|uniref:CARDB domain-containing protein n=1 Tax=Pseudoalteromonas rubra TaxID=43658 RepID=A0A5S3UV99_9GAMM|nr:hypothetical protein [Pseudoalteromonas rubra]QPB84323.1 hypothetical protein CWC22_015555 [Pseudoalteromonas rubra]
MRHLTRAILASAMLTTLAGCDLGGDDKLPIVIPVEQSKSNIAITKISTGPLETLEPNTAVRVFYDVDISGFKDIDVDVHFYLVHATELDTSDGEEAEIEEVHKVGALELTQVTEGSHSFETEITIPDTLLGGHYHLIAQIDPHDDHAEDIEEDNHPSVDHEPFSDGEFPFADLQVRVPESHDYKLLNAEFGQQALILDVPNNADGTSEHHSDLVGYLTADYEGGNLGSTAITAEVLVEGNWQPTHFWNTENAAYEAQLTHNFTAGLHDEHIGFDIALDDALLTQIYQGYDATQEQSLQIRFTLTDLAQGAETITDNNVIETEIPLYFFTGDDTDTEQSLAKRDAQYAVGLANIKLEKEFDKSYGNKSKFSVGVDLSGQLFIVPTGDPGGRITGEGVVEAYFFNAQNTLFSISYDGSAYISGQNTGYASEMIIFNNVAFEDEKYTTKYEKSWEKSWEEEKVLAQARFTIGPVPMSVEAGVTGSLGFELTVGYNAELYAEGDLFHVDFNAFGRGGVNLGLVSAGIQAILILIDNTFAMESNAGFALVSNGNKAPHIYYGLELKNDLDVISGKFGLYAETIGVKWCKKWGIPYPCGKKTHRYDLWLYQTPSVYNKSWTLYSKEDEIEL